MSKLDKPYRREEPQWVKISKRLDSFSRRPKIFLSVDDQFAFPKMVDHGPRSSCSLGKPEDVR